MQRTEEHPPLKGSRVKHFFEKHGQVLTFVGAVIVFMTYVTKEGIAEYWGETVAAVDQAEFRFRSIGLSTQLLRRINEVENSLERMENPSHGLSADVRVDEERINLNANEQDLAIARELLTKLHLPHSEEEARLQLARTEGAKYSESIRAVAERLVLRSDPVTLASEMMPLTMQGMAFEQSTGEVIKAVRRRALEEKERSERNLSLTRWITYILYTFGWGLGLAGKFYGPKIEEPVE